MVIDVEDDDPEMVAAISKARQTVGQFIAAMENPTSVQENFSVKVLVEEGDAGEHMWLLPVRLEGSTFVGTLSNEPVEVTHVEIGDELRVEKNEISDWMYVDQGKVVGGFSLRVLMERASPAEREAMQKAVQFAEE